VGPVCGAASVRRAAADCVRQPVCSTDCLQAATHTLVRLVCIRHRSGTLFSGAALSPPYRHSIRLGASPASSGMRPIVGIIFFCGREFGANGGRSPTMVPPSTVRGRPTTKPQWSSRAILAGRTVAAKGPPAPPPGLAAQSCRGEAKVERCLKAGRRPAASAAHFAALYMDGRRRLEVGLRLLRCMAAGSIVFAAKARECLRLGSDRAPAECCRRSGGRSIGRREAASWLHAIWIRIKLFLECARRLKWPRGTLLSAHYSL